MVALDLLYSSSIMGCSSSVTVDGAGVQEEGPELVIVGGTASGSVSNLSDRVTTIDIYNLGRNKNRRSLDLPKTESNGILEQLSHSYAAICSPNNPLLYITGGFYSNDSEPSSHTWQVHLSGKKRYEKLPDMPMALCRHRMCFATINNVDSLFVVGNDNKCFRYVFSKQAWYSLPKLPVKIRNVDAILCINKCLYVCGEGYLLLNHLRQFDFGDWFINQDVSFPRGSVSNLGEKIYIHKYDYKDNFIYLYDTWDDTLRQFSAVHESDIMARSAMSFLEPDILFFAGGFDEVLKKSSNAVVEYNVKLKRAVVACFLDSPREDHHMFINKHVCAFNNWK